MDLDEIAKSIDWRTLDMLIYTRMLLVAVGSK